MAKNQIMVKKKDENPFNPVAAMEIKPAELVSENIPAKSDATDTALSGGNSMEEKTGEKQTEKTTEGSSEAQISAVSATAPEIPPVATVTASQLVTENIPSVLPPAPGQPQTKRGRGRPASPHPECKKCGRKHKPGLCVAENGESQIVIPGNVPESADGEGSAEIPAEEKPGVNYRQLAEVCFDLSTNTAGAIIGPEWRAQDEKEREGMLIPLEMYLRAQEVKDIPPGAILCFAIAGYATVRLQVPNTRTKFNLAWAWIKSKMPGKRKHFSPKIVKDENPFSEKN